MREGDVLVVSRTGGRDVPYPRPRRGRNRPADAFVARRGVDREGEMRCWKLEKNVSGHETEGKTWAKERRQGGLKDVIDGQRFMTLTGHWITVRACVEMQCRAESAVVCVRICVCVVV